MTGGRPRATRLAIAVICAALCGLALVPPAQAQTPPAAAIESAAAHRERVVRIAREIMAAARYCSLVTIGEGGQPRARVVDPLAPDALMRVYVATNPASRKVAEIGRDPRVTLLYFDPARSAYVTLIGKAFEVQGAEKGASHKKEWQPFFSAEKPEAYTLYRIEASRLEVVSAKDGLSGDPTTWRPEIVDLK